MIFGEWVRSNRIKNEWTQKEMAEISRIPQTTISGWETGKVGDLKIIGLKRLAKVFKVRLCEIPLNTLFEDEMEDDEFQCLSSDSREKEVTAI